MAEPQENTPSAPEGATATPALEKGTYEIILNRLSQHEADLRDRLLKLNEARKEAFGSVEFELQRSERVTTHNNCVPRDMVPLNGSAFLFGYNVHIGLRTGIQLEDVFGLYTLKDGHFQESPLDLLRKGGFEEDFKSLYKYYKNTVFAKFSIIGPHLFMVFRVGKDVTDIKTFKWICHDGALEYVGNRFDHEFRFPPQHDVAWTRTHRDLHRHGLHPHISIEDRVFVECIGGDLTIKVEDNTESGEGIYAEEVEHADQTLDDAEVHFASLGNLILLKIRPYQEKQFRHFVFNEKLKSVTRIDAVGDACIRLPEDQGIIFHNGYYLQTGDHKQFESPHANMVYDARLAASNGEDFLFCFYHRAQGRYVLLPYNIIRQSVETPIHCHGYAFFSNGEMALFKSDDDPRKHHLIQIWQTPFAGQLTEPETGEHPYLRKVGNPDLVRCMADCHELLALLRQPDSYGNLYVDLIKSSRDIQDTFHWLDHEEAYQIQVPLAGIQEASQNALSEFDKVRQLRQHAKQSLDVTAKQVHVVTRQPGFDHWEALEPYVKALADLRGLRGHVLSLRDVRYMDLEATEVLEKEIIECEEKVAGHALTFLGRPDGLAPYLQRIDDIGIRLPETTKTVDAKPLEDELNTTAHDLETMTEVVGNLRIEDPTEKARIIECISGVFVRVNQLRAAIRKHIKSLSTGELSAEFASQSRLLDQSIVNYLELCDTPEKCEEFQTKLMVQLEELEAEFAENETFVLELADRRTRIADAFESRRLELVERFQRRSATQFAAAERILEGVQHRVQRLDSIDAIHGFFAGDMMVSKIRDLVDLLQQAGEVQKVAEVQSRLKSLKEESIRQLKDRKELYTGTGGAIRFGDFEFAVNRQELQLTCVPRQDQLCLHLTGTRFFMPIDHPLVQSSGEIWDQEFVSENADVYRSEYLAYQLFVDLESSGRLGADHVWDTAQIQDLVTKASSERVSEGYNKGVHDQDAAVILETLINMHRKLGLLRYPPSVRVCASLSCAYHASNKAHALLVARVRGFGSVRNAFPKSDQETRYVDLLKDEINAFIEATGLYEACLSREAARYLLEELQCAEQTPALSVSHDLVGVFEKYLRSHHLTDRFQQARESVKDDFAAHYQCVREWVQGFVSQEAPGSLDVVEEVAFLLWRDSKLPVGKVDATTSVSLNGLRGDHARLADEKYDLHFSRFMDRLGEYASVDAVRYREFQSIKKEIVKANTKALRLSELKAGVLSSFVRNQLIQDCYLPMVGANLAKQIGVAGESKRTDLMGLLLLISPPGYGKTTLMEYIANRLGLIFLKINGPAIGHDTVTLNPGEAPSAVAREELERLNFGFEMGDNIMIYLDDIQHLNPEFLQKFISLCDAQRKIEGVFRGQSKTYDLRGRRVAVVMAGNPYTESGHRFAIPDMLANRADIYNLGDVAGDSEDVFLMSYLENAVTSNSVLSAHLTQHQEDLVPLIRMAESGGQETEALKGSYAPQELQDIVSVLKKLVQLRASVYKVNQAYIHSAGQNDAYRSEPAFKLQGSYRNMNRLAEKVMPIMNDQELNALLLDHYKNESQTLTHGAESNYLKFLELIGQLDDSQQERWDDIKKKFRKNLLFGGQDDNDPVGRVVRQLSGMGDELDEIREAIQGGLEGMKPKVDTVDSSSSKTPVILIQSSETPKPKKVSVPMTKFSTGETGVGAEEILIDEETLKRIWSIIEDQNAS
jgi:hypothetical protein